MTTLNNVFAIIASTRFIRNSVLRDDILETGKTFVTIEGKLIRIDHEAMKYNQDKGSIVCSEWSVLSHEPLDYLNSDTDVAWWSQYGTPQQACFYPQARKQRARVMDNLVKKGFDIKLFNHRNPNRPNGYESSHKGYAYMWGLGGDFKKPNLPK